MIHHLIGLREPSKGRVGDQPEWFTRMRASECIDRGQREHEVTDSAAAHNADHDVFPILKSGLAQRRKDAKETNT